MPPLTFPVGYGAGAEAVAALTGAFVNPNPVYPQSVGFVLDPAGNVVVGRVPQRRHRQELSVLGRPVPRQHRQAAE
jgi:hypothetical protein